MDADLSGVHLFPASGAGRADVRGRVRADGSDRRQRNHDETPQPFHPEGGDGAQYHCRQQRAQCGGAQGHGLCGPCREPLQRSQPRASGASDQGERHHRYIRRGVAGASHAAAVGGAWSRCLSHDQGRTHRRRHHRMLGGFRARAGAGGSGDRQLEIVRRGADGLPAASRHGRGACRRRPADEVAGAAASVSAWRRSRSRCRVPGRSS